MTEKNKKNILCPVCGGRGYEHESARYGETCPKCYGAGTVLVDKTNLDIVREMPAEQLARFLESVYTVGRKSVRLGRPAARIPYLEWLAQSVHDTPCRNRHSLAPTERMCRDCLSAAELSFCYKENIFMLKEQPKEEKTLAVG